MTLFWIDSHCHFDVDDFALDRQQVAQAAWQAGVAGIVIPAYVARYWPQLLHVCQSITQPKLWPVLGLHPCYIAEHQEQDLVQLEQLLIQHPHVVALGEIGLDTYVAEIKTQDMYHRQQRFFVEQLQLAKKYQKPVILHVRKAHADIFRLLRQEKFTAGGIVHAFSGGVEEARMYHRLGFKLGIGGSVTYEQAKRLHAVVADCSLSDFVLETDAPDILPQPQRLQGIKRNSPVFLPDIAQALAQAKNVTLDELAQQMWLNTCQALQLNDRYGGWHEGDSTSLLAASMDAINAPTVP